MDELKNEVVETRTEEPKEDINSLKAKLDKINSVKEEWFSKKEELKKELNSLIAKIKEIKVNRDGSVGSVSELKKERDKYNGQVRELIKRIKELNKQRGDITAKHNIQGDPSRLKNQIEALESSIETEGFGFNKEKQIMDKIKILKKQYAEASKVNGVLTEINDVSRQIDEAKKKSDEFHGKIIDLVKTSKNGYSDFIKLSKQINEVKKKQEDAFEKFITFKKEFSEVNELLKSKLADYSQIKKKVKAKNVQAREEKKKEQEKVLQEMSKEVEEKIKSKKKLTTEDLLIFQQTAREE